MKKQATVSELAEVIGVTRSAISQAVTSGRLSKSISKMTKNHRRFEIYSACLEWDNSRDSRQVRGPRTEDSESEGVNYPPVAQSRQVFEYFQAINEQISALKQAGKFVDLEIAQREVFHAARLIRDRLLEIPDDMRFDYLAVGLSDADADSLIRKQSGQIHKALLQLSEMEVTQWREGALSESLKDISDSLNGLKNVD